MAVPPLSTPASYRGRNARASSLRGGGSRCNYPPHFAGVSPTLGQDHKAHAAHAVDEQRVKPGCERLSRCECTEAHGAGVAFDRTWNFDETGLRVLPTNSRRWAAQGCWAKLHGSAKPSTTLALVANVHSLIVLCQLLFGGKTSRSIPDIPSWTAWRWGGGD